LRPKMDSSPACTGPSGYQSDFTSSAAYHPLAARYRYRLRSATVVLKAPTARLGSSPSRRLDTS
jgi:hypothetical protein